METRPSILCAPSPSRSIAGSVKGAWRSPATSPTSPPPRAPAARAAHTAGTRYRCRSAEGGPAPSTATATVTAARRTTGPINIPANSEGASRPALDRIAPVKPALDQRPSRRKSFSQTDSAEVCSDRPGAVAPPLPSPGRAPRLSPPAAARTSLREHAVGGEEDHGGDVARQQ